MNPNKNKSEKMFVYYCIVRKEKGLGSERGGEYV